TYSFSHNIAKTPEEAEREYDLLSEVYDLALTERDYRPPEDASSMLADFVDPATAKVLDAGCGTGLLGPKLQEKGIKEITGMDISSKCLKEAEKKNAYNRTVKQNILEPLPCDKDSFDAVVCVGVFSRFNDKQILSILNEFARITRKRGIILFSHRIDLLESSNLTGQIKRSELFRLQYTSEPYKYIPGDEHYKNVFVRYFALSVQ
ncbi:MAG: class I SAM-dependent methyltransferase, partial [Candidatus Electrothrix sp. AR3]|nr:class I SAM-dependent methyltransferase [Candidatus Electrothrix sp. AR3]